MPVRGAIFGRRVTAGPSGGQASSKIARPSRCSVELGFVKILTRQDDTERRARFFARRPFWRALPSKAFTMLIETNAATMRIVLSNFTLFQRSYLARRCASFAKALIRLCKQLNGLQTFVISRCLQGSRYPAP